VDQLKLFVDGFERTLLNAESVSCVTSNQVDYLVTGIVRNILSVSDLCAARVCALFQNNHIIKLCQFRSGLAVRVDWK
jgi:hypothetical protein